MKPIRILFFIGGVSPTAEEQLAADAIPANVVFRNARAVPTEAHALEVCDGVAGKVPEIYAKAFPPADEAVAVRAKEIEALSKRVGDAPAPKAAGKAAAKPQEAAKAQTQAPAQAQPAAAPQQPAQAPAWTPNKA